MKTKKHRAYLSGGMEYARNEGSDWRTELEKWLKDELGHTSFNPNEESRKYLQRRIPGGDLRKLKYQDISAFSRLLHGIVDIDTREIAFRSDYVICLWDASSQRGAGTKGELTIARFFRKPVYMVTKTGKENIPGWIFGCTSKFFGSMNELKIFLQRRYGIKKRTLS